MGGSNSRQKKIRKRTQWAPAMNQEYQDTCNLNSYHQFGTNTHSVTSISSTIPTHNRSTTNYECGSSSRSITYPTEATQAYSFRENFDNHAEGEVVNSLDTYQNQASSPVRDDFDNYAEDEDVNSLDTDQNQGYLPFHDDFDNHAKGEVNSLDTHQNQAYSPLRDGFDNFADGEIVISLDANQNQAYQPYRDDFDNHTKSTDFSNLDNQHFASSKIQKNAVNLDKLSNSKEVLIDCLTLNSQPSVVETTILQTNVQSQNTIAINANSANENTQTNVCVIRGLKRNSWEVDEDEETSGESLPKESISKSPSKLSNLFDYPETPRVKRKVPNSDREHTSISITDSNYDGKSFSHGNNASHNSNNGLDDDTDSVIEVVCSDNEFNLPLYFNVLDILSFPSEWTSCVLDKSGLVDVIPESDEGRAILRLFERTSVSVSFKLQITRVTRIENPLLHSLYVLKKEEMESRNGHVDELYLYHGTKSVNIDQICNENLNWRLYTDRHRFGKGVSFSPSAIYSSHYSDSSNLKTMFLFKVLVSNTEFGSVDMVIPPIQNGVAFDTSIKDDTSVVVKYSDNEFYPLYKISYTRHSNV